MYDLKQIGRTKHVSMIVPDNYARHLSSLISAIYAAASSESTVLEQYEWPLHFIGILHMGLYVRRAYIIDACDMPLVQANADILSGKHDLSHSPEFSITVTKEFLTLLLAMPGDTCSMP